MCEPIQHRRGGWLPKDHQVLRNWIQKHVDKVQDKSLDDVQVHPVIKRFQRLIESDAELYMGFHQMFEQVPTKPPYNKDPTGESQVRNYKTMLLLFNDILTEAPDYQQNDLVGFPINAILDWPMGTPAGFRVFVDPRVNLQFNKMFDVWSAFLTSSKSTYVLTTANDGWFGPLASEAIPNFDTTFKCDPLAPFHGFTSWDDFFTREFRDGLRPIEFPDDDNIINSACESTVYNTAYDIKLRDYFWLKEQPYSLLDMLNHDTLTEKFVGGSIYQAFLSATSYHRWHSPVNGKIVKTVNIPGTYYAESPYMGFNQPGGPDPAAPNDSQAFITSIAARALIFIEADNPNIGLMAFLAVGMAEVSTCEVTVNPGQVVKKGDQLGTFHFGGSTHCLIFRPETPVVFSADYPNGTRVVLGAAFATVQ